MRSDWFSLIHWLVLLSHLWLNTNKSYRQFNWGKLTYQFSWTWLLVWNPTNAQQMWRSKLHSLIKALHISSLLPLPRASNLACFAACVANQWELSHRLVINIVTYLSWLLLVQNFYTFEITQWIIIFLKVKNKKRWSQVMYMSYVLDFKEKLMEGNLFVSESY